MGRLWICVVLGSIGCGGAIGDDDELEFRGGNGNGGQPFSVEFEDCQEFAGVFPVPLANVASRVPADYEPVTYDGVNGFVVFRTVQCEGLVFENGDHECEPTIVSQVGVNLVAPQGEGDINNYALHYSSTSQGLVKRLKHAGVDAQRVNGLAFEFDDDDGDGNGTYDIHNPKKPYKHTMAGPASDPPASDPGIPFVANWWQDDKSKNVLMSTDIDTLYQGDGSQVVVTTPANSEIAEILGGTSTGAAVFAIRGVFPGGVMDVQTLQL